MSILQKGSPKAPEEFQKILSLVTFSFTCYFFFHFTLSSLRLWGMLLSARHRTPVPPLLPLASFRTIVLIQRKGSGKKHSACISRYDFDITMQLQSLTSSRYNFNLPTSPSCTKANSPHTLQIFGFGS